MMPAERSEHNYSDHPNGTATAAVDDDKPSALGQMRAAAGAKNDFRWARLIIDEPSGMVRIEPRARGAKGLHLRIAARIWNNQHLEMLPISTCG